MKSPKPRRIILYIVLIFFAFVFLLPLWTDLTTSFKSLNDVIYTNPVELPRSPTIEPLIAAFNIMKGSLVNSLEFTLAATILSCLLGSINGYALTKIKFQGANIIFLLFSIGIFLPYQAILVPLVLTISRLGLFNTLWGLILTHTTYGITITTLLFRNFYGLIPDSLIMAAKIDGAGTWTIYRRIILPLSLLPFVVAAVLQFTSIWNDFLFAVTLANRPGIMPASVALANLKGTTEFNWNIQMAGALWYALPILIIYLVLGKYLIRGYMAGAIKG